MSTTTQDHGAGHGAQHGAADHGHAHHEEPGFFLKYLWSTDHKMIGFQYLFTGMAMALIGGFTVYVFRMQQAFPGVSVPGWGRVTARIARAMRTAHILRSRML